MTSIIGFTHRSGKRSSGPMGITAQLFTDPARSNRVGLLLEIPDVEAFQKLSLIHI